MVSISDFFSIGHIIQLVPEAIKGNLSLGSFRYLRGLPLDDILRTLESRSLKHQ